jgi:hypothetical protein
VSISQGYPTIELKPQLLAIYAMTVPLPLLLWVWNYLNFLVLYTVSLCRYLPTKHAYQFLEQISYDCEKVTAGTCRAVTVPCPNILIGWEMLARYIYDWLRRRFPHCRTVTMPCAVIFPLIRKTLCLKWYIYMWLATSLVKITLWYAIFKYRCFASSRDPRSNRYYAAILLDGMYQ